MKKYLVFVLSIFLSLSRIEGFDFSISDADDITYDWLVKNGELTGTTDHVPHIREIFKKTKIKTCLEFGVGHWTKYFLDYCNKVISVEFITSGYGPETVKKCMELYRDYSNWIPIIYFTGYRGAVTWAPYKYLGSEAVYKATSYQAATGQNYARVDRLYLTELNSFIDRLVQVNTIDLGFVGGAIYLRGDLVQLMFNKISIIVAHGTFARHNPQNDPYGYSRLVVPENYEEIFFSQGSGTTAWVLKSDEFSDLIAALKQYAKTLNKEL